MEKYYLCSSCKKSTGEINTGMYSDPLGSTYQQDKYKKHTVPTTGYDKQSVFIDFTETEYTGLIQEAVLSGSLEVDEQGRKNIIYPIREKIGVLYSKGIPIREQDVLKVVCSTDGERVHGFTISSTTLSTGVCKDCNNPIYI